MKFFTSFRPKGQFKDSYLVVFLFVFLFFFLSISPVIWASNSIYKPTNRIVSASPSITETLFELGLKDSVIAVTDFCKYPQEACKLPSIGGAINPNIEVLVSLQPDLVLHLSHSAKLARNTKSLDIPSFGINMDTLADILNSIKILGKTLGVEKNAEQLIKKLTEGINSYKEKLKGIAPKKALLLLGDSSDPGRDLYATGHGTFLHELLEISGGKNILPATMARYPRITKEYIIEKSPEVIIEAGPKSRLTPPQIKERIKGWERFPSIRAVQKGQIHYIGADYILIPGPRLLNIIEQFSRAIHPDIFLKEGLP